MNGPGYYGSQYLTLAEPDRNSTEINLRVKTTARWSVTLESDQRRLPLNRSAVIL